MRTRVNYILAGASVIELIVIGVLFTRDRIGQRVTTDLIRGQLVAEAAKMNLYLRKLESGDVESVRQTLQSGFSNNVAILQSRLYGEMDQDQRNALNKMLSHRLGETDDPSATRPSGTKQ